jgi:syntaxin 16
MSSLPPAWTDVQDEVSTMLGTIAAKSSALDRLHQKHVLPGFDDNRAKEEGEIERLTSEITTLFHKCQNAIRKMETMGNSGGGEGVMRRNAQMALAAKVQEISTNFRKKQSAYLKSMWIRIRV